MHPAGPPLMSPVPVAVIPGVGTPVESRESLNGGSSNPGSVDQACSPYDPNGQYESEFDQRGNNLQQKKLFVGGLHWRTVDDDLRQYFSGYGAVTDAMVSQKLLLFRKNENW
jgi:RNA recognition motif-containing protein